MRMRNVFVRRGRMGIERNNAIVAGMAVDQIAPVESDLELAKVNAFQFDRLGRDRQRLLGMVPRNPVEFVVQGEHVVIDVLNRGDWLAAMSEGIKSLSDVNEFTMQAINPGS
jgi:hypothetical protein